MTEETESSDSSSHREFDPRPYHARVVEAFRIANKPRAKRTDEEQKKLDAWHIHEALAVAADFMPFKRPDQPERPPSFPDGDEDLRYALKRAQGARHRTTEEKTLLRECGDWQQMRWRTEHEGSSRVQALYSALRALDQVLVSHPTDAVLASARAEIVAFMRREWQLDEQAITPGFFEARDIGDRASRTPPSTLVQLRSVLEEGKVEPSRESSDREEW